MNNQQTPRRPKTVSELYPEKWLAPDDLSGRQFTLTISRIEFDLFPVHPRTQERITKAVVFFTRAKKALILNKTQSIAIAEIAGTETYADWPGTKIVLAPGTADNGKPTILILPPKSLEAPDPEQPAKPDPDQTAADTGIFDATFGNGQAVPEAMIEDFNNYRRANGETVPPTKIALENWSGNHRGKYHV